MKKKRKRNRKSIISFAASFPNEESAIKFYEKIRWKDGVVSPSIRHLKCTNARTVNISARILGNTSLIELGHSLLILKWILEIGCTQ